MRKFLCWAVVLTVVSLGWAGSGCGYQSFKDKGMWQEFPGIYTAVEPMDLGVYRRLLPRQLEMPDRPVVAFFIVDYVTVVPWPMGPYLEGAVALSCKYKGEDGFHVLTMPVTEAVANQGGRSLGFPKYVADEIILAQSGQGWKGVVTHRGKVRLSLEFTPGLTRELSPVEKELIGGPMTRMEVTSFQLVPPGKGPRLNRITLAPVVPAKWETRQGMVRIHISPDDPWAGLVPDGTMSPGLFQVFTGGNNMVTEKME